MIIGIFIRNFKGYGKTVFVPVSGEDNFTVFIGENGAGKTSVLEALNCFFNKKQWIKNIFLKDVHLETSFVQPVLFIPDEQIPEYLKDEAAIINDTLWKYHDYNLYRNNNDIGLRYFSEFLATLDMEKMNKTGKLITIGVNYLQQTCNTAFENIIDHISIEWLDIIRNIYHLIFIPTLPEPENIISQLYFKNREDIQKWVEKLCRDEYNNLPLSYLDSGEKQQFIVSFLKYIIEHAKETKYILAFDEHD